MKTIEINDILVTDIGYSMTLPIFYKVIKRTTQTLSLQRLGQKTIEGDGMIGYCVPTEIESTNNHLAQLTARIKSNSDHEYAWRAKDRMYFKMWNGKPEYHNHMD